MSKGVRIAAVTGIWIAVALLVTLGAIYPWFSYRMASLQWALGMITGWLLCSSVKRKLRD